MSQSKSANLSSWVQLSKAFLILFCCYYSSPAFASETSGRLIVKYKKNSANFRSLYLNFLQDQLREQRLRSSVDFIKGGLRKNKIFDSQKFTMESIQLGDYLHPVTDEDMKEAINKIRALPDVEYVEEDPVASLASVGQVKTRPSDTYLDRQWHFSTTNKYSINIQPVWDAGFTGSKQVVIGVVDTGISYSHPDLAENIYVNGREIAGDGIDNDGNGFIDDRQGWNFYNDIPNAFDESGHGTHVAGILGAIGNNALGTAGVAWNSNILPLRYSDAVGHGFVSYIIGGLQYAVNSGVQVVNISVVSYTYSQAFFDALLEAQKRGVIVVSSAGNDSNDNDSNHKSYPASYSINQSPQGAGERLDNIISVAAIAVDGTVARFSNYGKSSVHLSAPGDRIYSTDLNNDYAYRTGTSMSAPMVTGAAALLKSRYPQENYQQTIARLVGCTTQLPDSELPWTFSGGTLNVAAAFAGGSCATLAPTDPIDIKVNSAGANSIQWSWSRGTKVDSYVVDFRKGSQPAADCRSGQNIGAKTTFSATQLEAGVPYSIRVCSVNSKYLGTSQGVTSTAQTISLNPPAPVGLRNATPDSTSAIQFAWASGGGNTQGYRYEIAEGSAAPQKACAELIQSTSQTSVVKSGLAPESIYSIRVCATNALGLFSAPVDLTAVTAKVFPIQEVSGIRAKTSESSRILLQWNPTQTVPAQGESFSYLIKWVEGSVAPENCDGAQRASKAELLAGGMKHSTNYAFRICVASSTGRTSIGATQVLSTIRPSLSASVSRTRVHKVYLDLGRNFSDVAAYGTVKICKRSNSSSCDSKNVQFGVGESLINVEFRGLKRKTEYEAFFELQGYGSSGSAGTKTKKGFLFF